MRLWLPDFGPIPFRPTALALLALPAVVACEPGDFSFCDDGDTCASGSSDASDAARAVDGGIVAAVEIVVPGPGAVDVPTTTDVVVLFAAASAASKRMTRVFGTYDS